MGRDQMYRMYPGIRVMDDNQDTDYQVGSVDISIRYWRSGLDEAGGPDGLAEAGGPDGLDDSDMSNDEAPANPPRGLRE